MSLFTEAGHPTQKVVHDYGEDLLVQVRDSDGRVRSVKLWVQVKGTRADCSKKLPVVRIKPEHSFRWHDTADLVVAVLWSVETKVGWYSLPSFYLDEEVKAHRYTTIKFRREDELNESSVEKLITLAGMRHSTRELLYTTVVTTGLIVAGPQLAAVCRRFMHISLSLLFGAIGLGVCRVEAGEPREGLACIANFLTDNVRERELAPSELVQLTRSVVSDVAVAVAERRLSINLRLIEALKVATETLGEVADELEDSIRAYMNR